MASGNIFLNFLFFEWERRGQGDSTFKQIKRQPRDSIKFNRDSPTALPWHPNHGATIPPGGKCDPPIGGYSIIPPSPGGSSDPGGIQSSKNDHQQPIAMNQQQRQSGGSEVT